MEHWLRQVYNVSVLEQKVNWVYIMNIAIEYVTSYHHTQFHGSGCFSYMYSQQLQSLDKWHVIPDSIAGYIQPSL